MPAFFFFSSRRRHTRFDCDWSSDVCSSDLYVLLRHRRPSISEGEIGRDLCSARASTPPALARTARGLAARKTAAACRVLLRSEERRVGKECRSRCAPYEHKEKCRIREMQQW